MQNIDLFWYWLLFWMLPTKVMELFYGA